MSAPENRRLSRNGGHRSIEEDGTKNICLTGSAKRTSVFGCVIPRGKGIWRTIALPDCGLGPELALSDEADGAERTVLARVGFELPIACGASCGSMERDAMASLASEVSQVLTTMKGQDLTVNSLRQALLEQQSMDVQANELQSVLRRLAQEEGTTFQYNERNGQIKVF